MMLKIVSVAIGLVLSAVIIVPALFFVGVILLNVSVDDPSLTPDQQAIEFLMVIGVAAALLCGIWVIVFRANTPKKLPKELDSITASHEDTSIWPPPPDPSQE